MILRIGVLAVLLFLFGFLLGWIIDWIKDKDKEITFKDLIFKSAYGLYIVILSCIAIPMMLFILWAQILDPFLDIFRRM